MSKNHIAHSGASMADYKYTVFFEPLAEGGYQVVFPSIPEIVTFGRSLEEARQAAHEALRCHIEGLIKDGFGVPPDDDSIGEPIKETVDVSI
jgi:predicted RNase H-like HicB family nuclease